MDLQNETIELQKVFHQDYKTYWEETEAIKAHLEARFKALGLYDVSISLPDYEYEMLIDDEGTPFEINSWIPIATNRIKDLSRINEYIEKGLIRKRQ